MVRVQLAGLAALIAEEFNMWHLAVENVGKDIVIIKDNKIFAKGRSVAMRGNDYVSIKLCEEDQEKFFGKMDTDSKAILKSIGHIHISPYSGAFLQMSLDYEGLHKEIEEQFENTFAVDHFNLRYGIVPDHFKTAEDYRSAIEEAKQEAAPTSDSD